MARDFDNVDLNERLRQVQAGDVDAFADVVRVYQRPIRAWITSRCPPGGDADEVAQKTFVQAFKHIDEYCLGTDFRAWLFAIARCQLMAECTRLKRLADYHSRYVPHALSQELQRRAGQREDLELGRLKYLEECMNELDEHARRILGWRYAEERTLGEIAELTERSVGAIKKHLFVLRRKLHDCIERKLGSEGV